MNYFSRLAIIYPIIVPLIGLIIFLQSGQWIGIYFTITSLLFGELFNGFLKYLFELIAPNYKLFQRPNPPTFGCSCFPWVKNDPSFGMPSGHSQITLFTSVFWILYLLDNYSFDFKTSLAIGILSLIAIYVPYTRIQSGCHNLIQVLIGSLIGGVLGYFSYEMYKKYYTNI